MTKQIKRKIAGRLGDRGKGKREEVRNEDDLFMSSSRLYAAGHARLIKRRLFDPAAALSEAPGRHAAWQITARVCPEPHPTTHV